MKLKTDEDQYSKCLISSPLSSISVIANPVEQVLGALPVALECVDGLLPLAFQLGVETGSGVRGALIRHREKEKGTRPVGGVMTRPGCPSGSADTGKLQLLGHPWGGN